MVRGSRALHFPPPLHPVPEGDNFGFPQYAQPVTKKGGKKDAAPEGEEEKKQSNHVVRTIEERKKGQLSRLNVVD